MPKTQNEDDKKHGDKMAPLIERTQRGGGAGKRANDADAAQLQDDDDEDMQNDAPDSGRDVGGGEEIKPVR
ncbi:MAG TPA: hypothetical protein VM692_08905 [Gammaproteobacteria bacterium]|nr:hypothetical protein [Gammaproteobacteria bacterium]